MSESSRGSSEGTSCLSSLSSDSMTITSFRDWNTSDVRLRVFSYFHAFVLL
jgi:hypothetical protein